MEKNLASLNENAQFWAGTNQELCQSVLNAKQIETFKEESVFPNVDLTNVNVLYVYGVGSGKSYLDAKEWLKENDEHFLIFFEDDLSAIRSLLETERGSQLIRDRQVRLFYFQDTRQLTSILDLMCVSLIFQKYQLCALPHYREKKHERLMALHVQISHVTEKYQVSNEYLNYGRGYYVNAYRNFLDLPNAYLADKLFGKFENIPAIICGAGPSLDKNFEELQKIDNQALIFAGSTAFAALAPGKVQPHFGIGIDPNRYQVSRLMLSNAFDTPIFFSERWNHDASRLAFGPHLYTSVESHYQTTEWMAKELGIEQKKVSAGHNVVNFGISLAIALGCDPIILIGVDQAYPAHQSYASTVVNHPLDDWKSDFKTKTPHNELLLRRDIHGNTVQTLWKWIREAHWISECAARHASKRFINATEGGIGFAGIPNMPLAEVREKVLRKTYDLKKMVKSAVDEAKMPEQVTRENIIDIYQRLGISLQTCEQLCETIQKEAAMGKKNSDALAKLEGEVAYSHVLDLFDRAFFSAFQHAFLAPAAELPEEERKKIESKRAKMDAHRYAFLRKVCRENLKTLELAILLYHSEKELEGRGKVEARTKEGRLDGDVCLYHPNGQIARKIPFVKGSRHGKEQMWDPKGQLVLEAEYAHNAPCGIARKWYYDGTLEKEVIYSDDNETCQVRRWNRKGELLPEESLKKADYFDQVSSYTETLTCALKDIYESFNRLSKFLMATSDEELEKRGLKDLPEQLKTLKEEIDRLSQMSVEIGAMLKHEDNLKEETLWKTPMSRKMINSYLKLATEKMSSDMKRIQEALNIVLKNFQS